MIRVETWPLDGESEPELYMTVNQEKVSCTSYIWVSEFGGDKHIDSKEIRVYPDDAKFSKGTFCCVVHAC